MTGAGRREITHEHGLRKAAILGRDVGASVHTMWWCQCWASGSRRFRPDTADTEVM